jgi:hypothetical protein
VPHERATPIATTEHIDSEAAFSHGTVSQLDDDGRDRPARAVTGVQAAGCVVDVARTADEVEALRDTWMALRGDSVQTDLDYYLWSLREEPSVLRPHVVTLQRAGRVETLVVARLRRAQLPCRVGHKTIYAPEIRAISVVRGGLLGRADAETAEVVTDALVSELHAGDADAVLFRQLERGCALHRATLARTTFATRQSFSQTDRRWQIALSRTFDDYLASRSSSTRKGIRRTACHLEQELGDRLTIRISREPAELDRFFRDADAIAARTYQRGLGVGFDGSLRQRARTEMLMEHGWFRGYVLYVDERPAAFEQGELYGGRFLSLSAGYDPDYGHQRVGAYLLVKAIEDLAADPDVLVFDFGFGDAEYKGRLADRCIEEGDVVVYARRPRPLAVSFSRAAVLGTVSAARMGLGRAALLDRARKWRRRRAGGTQSVVRGSLGRR